MKKILTVIIAIVFSQSQAFCNPLGFSTFVLKNQRIPSINCFAATPIIYSEKQKAGMDVNVLAGENYESASRTKFSTSALGISSGKEEHSKETTTAVASSIKGQGIKIIAEGMGFDGNGKMTGGNVNIQGADLTAGSSGILVTASNDINITTKVEKTNTKDVKEGGNFVSGNDANGKTVQSGTNRGTNMASDGNILIVAQGNVTSVSANYNTSNGGNAYLVGGHTIDENGKLAKAQNADGTERKGSAQLYAAQDYKNVDTYSKHTGGLVDAVSNIDVNFNNGLTLSTSYKESSDKSHVEDLTAKVNKIDASGNIKLMGTQDVISVGSELKSGKNIDVEAGNDILFSSAKNSHSEKKEHDDTTITVGVKVGNAYLDAYNAGDATVKAGEAVKRASDEVSKMEQLYKEGKASQQAVDDAKANLVMATANLANATIGLAASIAGAATAGSSTLGTGLYASGFANYDTNSSKSKTDATTSLQGVLNSGGNITFNAGNNMTQEGTSAYAKDTLTYNVTNDLTIQASKDTLTGENSSKHISGGVSVGNNSVQVSAGYGESSERMSATTYTNSESMAQNVVINAKNATLSGANVHATNDLTVDVKNNLTVESLQDTYYAKGKSFDASVSVGGSNSGGSIGGGYSQNSNTTDKAWVTQQTTLTGGNKADITVGGKTTITGAVIANADISRDAQGNVVITKDNGNLNLSTKEFEHKDLQDRNVSQNKGFGINTSIGASVTDKGKANVAPNGSTTLSLTNTGNEQTQTTKATLGQGNITIGGQAATQEQLSGLNRDVTNSQTVTKDQITSALNASVTIDNRVFTSAGRASIISDFKNVGKNASQVYTNITKNNIVVQTIGTALRSDNNLNLLGAAKEYLGLTGNTKQILSDEKLNKDINGLTNLDVEGMKGSMREMAGIYNEQGDDLNKIEFSRADDIGLNGITTINLSYLDMTDPNAIAATLAGITSADQRNAYSRADMASSIMDMMNYGNTNTNTMTTEQWLNKTGSNGILYGNSLFDPTWDSYSNKKISTLDPRLQNPAADFINDAKDNLGINLRVTDAYRSIEEQDEKYAQGRRGIPGEKTVTDAKGGKSYHNYGLAIDVVAMEKNNTFANYEVVPHNLDLIGIGNSYGFYWGVKLKDGTLDTPHFEMPFGQKPSELYKQYLNNREKK